GSQPENPGTPDNNQPENPDAPDDNQPETPGTPDGSQPENPGTPDNNQPENPSVPDTDTENASFVRQVVNLVNQERAKAGLSPVTADTSIQAAAQVRAKEIEKSFSHTRPDGSSFSTALTQQGVTYRGSGENIAWGQKTPEQVMNGWMNSDGHRANILNKNFTKIGVGYHQNASGTNYWTQLFTY
ncbi:CAP domain-containing protein, partial [Blautia marasmi]|nr:CAP domain-containing protein [Blautia marasmi]